MASSPLPFEASSPIARGGARSPLSASRYTYRNLSQMVSYATSCPLRVIAHVDLDAFYAQCEMVRLGVPEDKPLAVQQWKGLIAINYPAREFGIGRHCTIEDARKLCPNLVAQHVATWREGDERWAYHDEAALDIATHKVSLDPYRLQSRKILALIKDCLPESQRKVEKASIDEVFIDLSAQVHSILLERFPELANPPPYDDPTERLPLPPISALDWKADALVDLESREEEADEPDWDDVAILVGSEIVRGIRATIQEQLHYTCSAGIANNKMLAKLGSGHKKPNQQTVVRTRAVQYFLSDFKFTKIRNLGGKLGDQVAATWNTEMVKDLLNVPLEQLKAKLGDDTGIWLFNTTRGIDTSEVNSRTQIKSMLSAKSFRPSINTCDQAVKWLRIFAADIFSRLVEEGVLENKRRPRTINLHHRHGGQTKSRQSPIPQGKSLDESTLFGLAKNLLDQIIAEGQVWPCANLSLSVGGFEEGVQGNMGIGAFLLKGEEAQALRSTSREVSREPSGEDSSPSRYADKRRKVEDGGIQRFFSKTNASRDANNGPPSKTGGDAFDKDPDHPTSGIPEAKGSMASPHQEPITAYVCSRCNITLDSKEVLQSHRDWHFAKDLQDKEERVESAFARSHARPGPSHGGIPKPAAGATSSKRGRGGKKVETGQRKLHFG